MRSPVVNLHRSHSLSSSQAQGTRRSSWLDRFVDDQQSRHGGQLSNANAIAEVLKACLALFTSSLTWIRDIALQAFPNDTVECIGITEIVFFGEIKLGGGGGPIGSVVSWL
jgi:hypothetical protein